MDEVDSIQQEINISWGMFLGEDLKKNPNIAAAEITNWCSLALFKDMSPYSLLLIRFAQKLVELSIYMDIVVIWI